MNTVPAGADSPVPQPAPAAAIQHPRARLPLGLVLAWLLAIAAIAVSVLLWQKVDGMQRQLARQSADAGNNAVEARTLARRAEELARDNAAKTAVLESKFSDMAAYRAQIEELVQTASRSRDDNLAVELETALHVAQDQSQLTGSVDPLLAALRSAERRLARSSDPRLKPVARAVARDLERVKAASIPDTAGLLARIDQLLRQTDELPMANDVGRARLDAPPRATANKAPRAAGAASAASADEPPAATWWSNWWDAALDEARGLVRVSRVERPEATMLSPEQAFFVRENLKLHLQGARLALLARQYEAARADLAMAQASLSGWFDQSSRRTQSALALLQQIQGQTKAADLPRAQDTLSALASAAALSADAAAERK